MADIDISETGEVIVPPEIKGTHDDPTLPLVTRVRLLAEKGNTGLLSEVADHLAGQRKAAERRANTQAHLQQQVMHQRQEIDFLRKFIRLHLGEDADPEFFIPVG